MFCPRYGAAKSLISDSMVSVLPFMCRENNKGPRTVHVEKKEKRYDCWLIRIGRVPRLKPGQW